VTVIQNQLESAQEGGTVTDVTVTVRLRAGHGMLDDGEHEVIRTAPVTTTTAAGFWSLDLVPSAEYEDTGAYYDVQEGTQRWTVLVPATGGPYWLREVLSDPPPASGPALGLTQTQGDARYQQLAGRGVANGYASLDGTGKVPAGQLPPGSGGGGVTDHGDLTGLTPDDDHPQYLTNARGDARYAPLGPVQPRAVGPLHVTSGAGGGDTNPNTGGVWQQLTGPGEIAVTAAAGDWVECTARFLSQDSGGSTYDLAILKAGSLVWFSSTAAGAPGIEGDPGMYPVNGSFTGKTGVSGLVAGAGHIDTDGKVHFVVAMKAAGSGKTYYSADYPFRWYAKNLGPPAP
jgi:hypothetical protein